MLTEPVPTHPRSQLQPSASNIISYPTSFLCVPKLGSFTVALAWGVGSLGFRQNGGFSHRV